jgi:hypothetical protein
MVTIFLILLAVTLGVAVVLGVLAKMEVKEIVAQCAAMGAAAFVFWYLVTLL